MRYTTLSEWLDWQESLHSKEIDMGLERITLVAERMGLLSLPCKTVTVAGTNGKGSCIATLEALSLANGLSVGAFTSPHLHHYNERIRVNGDDVSDELICESFQRIDEARGQTSLTYFEFGALAALDIFSRSELDIALLEVGLGGRLDAVNILSPDISVVTSVAIDHEAWLGNDREVIGQEKAGIYRAGRPAICADISPPNSIAKVAGNLGAHLQQAGQEFDWAKVGGRWMWRWWPEGPAGELRTAISLPIPSLPESSVAAALLAFRQLGYSFPRNLPGVITGLNLSGRTQAASYRGRQVLLDVAHNPAAAEHLAQYFRDNPVPGRTRALVAMMADKDLSGVFRPLLQQIDRWVVADLADNSRAATKESLARELASLGADSESVESVSQGLEALAGDSSVDDRILVFGSFFTVADAQLAIDEVESAQ